MSTAIKIPALLALGYLVGQLVHLPIQTPAMGQPAPAMGQPAPADMPPPHIQTLALRMDGGFYLSDFDQMELSNFIENHPKTWNKWASLF